MTKFITWIFVGFLGLLVANGAAWAACKPGTKDCVTSNPTTPKPCGGAGHPCTIEGGGLGSVCQGGGAYCGLAGQTLPTNSTGRATTPTGTTVTHGTAAQGAMRH